MRIIIDTIPHNIQAYPTCGDYKTDESGVLHIYVSQMDNWKHEALIAVHELIEALLCKAHGISDGEITAFDVEFEGRKKTGDLSEPGDDRAAPYAWEHCLATAVERLLCANLGVSWQDYEQAVQRLSK